MRKVFFIVLLLIAFAYSSVVREMKFENVKLETVLKALSQVSGLNIIFDPQISSELQKTVSVAIYRPIPVGEAFNIILKEYNLIAVPVDAKVYRITKAGELTIDISSMSDEQINRLIQILKSRVSPSAEVVLDRTLKKIFVRDEESRIKRLEASFKDLRALPSAQEEERITKVFYIKYAPLDEAKRRILPYTNPKTFITEVPSFNALVITDTPQNIQKYEDILKGLLSGQPTERRPVTAIFYLKYISPEEFIKMIEPLRSESGLILSGGAYTQPQQQTQQQQQQSPSTPTPILKEFNAVMVTDYPEVIERIRERFKEYISDQPVRVSIEARIVEIREEALRELGINWNMLLSSARLPEAWSGGVGSNIGIGSPPTPGNLFLTPPYLQPGLSPNPGGILTLTYQKGIINALNLRISALERVNLAKSLAKPTIVAINGQKATIKQGVQVPYLTAAVGAGGTAVPNIQFKDVVLQLDVTPIVSPDGRILLDLSLTRDTLGVQTPQGPAINKKEVRTKVIVENGQTLVIGGVIDNQSYTTNEGIPGFVRVPLLKYLFGQERLNKSDTELLIFITPTVLTQ
ncbi:type II and III secretion system protein [Thermocrinis albus DSM 14484]|uniref:Type II and III secretion system protein n=1 Tax=Thermocrinis albus (strain DSM 14484 / JCM 11386 / HI 11/12) TaxID=638303 RepID=D3SNE5_THEAH|nr:type II and III secretion system protein [Thermocrinis albus]ADC88682.1 type II and III secretion system protein [Thermocrinis albus DSM 14484]